MVIVYQALHGRLTTLGAGHLGRFTDEKNGGSGMK